MEQIELVIKMPREDYALIMSGRFYLGGSRGNGKTITSDLMKSICRGTLLPSGHGRLIDADALKKEAVMCPTVGNAETLLLDIWNVEHAPTIIEADKEGAEE